MLKEFIEKHKQYRIFREKLSQKTSRFIVLDLATMDSIEVFGISAKYMHKKYKDELLKTDYAQYIRDVDGDIFLIEGELWLYRFGAFKRISGEQRPVLVQNMKTKTKVLSANWWNVQAFVQDFIVNNSMHNTKEKPLIVTTNVNMFNFGCPLRERFYDRKLHLYSTYQQDPTIEYNMPKDEMLELIKTHFILVDKKYNVVSKLPREFNDTNINEVNECLLTMFGTRKNKPIFEIRWQNLPALKGDKLCYTQS